MIRRRAAFGALVILVLGLTFVAPARAASLQSVTGWTGNATGLPSDVSMWVYVPAKVATNPPILTLIHSCDSNAQVVFGQASGLVSAADQYGFIMVVPQSNPTSLRCWTTDSDQVWKRDSGGDSNAIKQMVVYALTKYNANANRVYVTGCSSGAMMTELLLAVYPDIFKAGSSFAGMPAGCRGSSESGTSTGYSGACAGGQVTHTAQEWGDIARNMDPGYTGHRPRLQLFHGDADTIISFKNMGESEKQYQNLLSLGSTATTTQTGITLGKHQGTRSSWTNACGYLVLDAFDSIGGDHGPSDALFLPQYVVPFLGLDKAGDTDPEIAQCGGGGSDAGTGAGGASGTGGSAGGNDAGAGARDASSTGAGGSVAGSGGSVGRGGSSSTGGSLGGGGNAGSGGGSAAGGAQASGGQQATGGSGSGGASATGGAPGSGGSASSGGAVAIGAGGASSKGGASGNSASGGSKTNGGSSSSGCSFIAGGGARGAGILALTLGLALVLARRRRR